MHLPGVWASGGTVGQVKEGPKKKKKKSHLQITAAEGNAA
jgi:hypothetical protein